MVPQQTQVPRKTFYLIASVVALLLIIVISLFGYLIGTKQISLFSQVSKNNSAAISGKIDLNGYVPDGSIISIAQRKVGDSDFKVVINNLNAVDGITWHWDTAVSGVEYEIRAYLKKDQNLISESNAISVVAPAVDEILIINSVAVPPSKATATISGSIDLNGYIPPQSTLTLEQRKKGETNFTVFQSGIPAVDGASFRWDAADSGVSYDLQAYLTSNGKTVGQSTIITIAAPADSEVLVVNSQASPPGPSIVSVSGRIGINGPVPGGSTISIGERVNGGTQFNIFASGISPNDGTSWSYLSAQSGTSYDFQAYLMSNNNVVSQSQILTVAAPAVNEVLNINIASPPPSPPGNSINTSCLGKSPANNLWQIRISYNNNQPIKGAKQYWVTLGKSSTGNEFVNSVIVPPNPDQTQTLTTDYVLNEGVSYYTQYAYSNCNSCSTFSQFSPSYQFSCVPTPTPTNTPIPPPPTNSPFPTLLPTDTPAPTDTPTPTIEPPPTNLPQ